VPTKIDDGMEHKLLCSSGKKLSLFSTFDRFGVKNKN
jgi:hypothetical protein